MNFSPYLLELADQAEAALAPQFLHLSRVSHHNTARVMEAFAAHHVDAACFNGSSGYGYDDRGREVLDRIFADVMGAEAAFVRHSIANGTQALAIGLFGLLRRATSCFRLRASPMIPLVRSLVLRVRQATDRLPISGSATVRSN